MAPAMSSIKTEQEEKLDTIFSSLEATFKKVDRCKDDAKIQAMLKEITNKLKDAKTLIKEFEREARTDGMPARDLADRKRNLVNELNNFIAMKKGYSTAEDNRGSLLAGAAPPEVDMGNDGKTVQELMQDGRKQIQETEQTLNRAEKLVEDTMAIGQQTAATLHDQTNQLNKVVDDLNEIEFTMKKASKVIADITKGLMTDRCISCLLLLVVLGVIALVIVKVINPNKKAISQAANAAVDAANITVNTSGLLDNTLSAITGRRLAARMLYGALAAGLDSDGHPYELLGQ